VDHPPATPFGDLPPPPPAPPPAPWQQNPFPWSQRRERPTAGLTRQQLVVVAIGLAIFLVLLISAASSSG
jgi:hypothetical protein